MRHLARIVWMATVLLIAVAAAGATLIATRVGGDAVVNTTLGFTVVAALAAVVAAIITAIGNKETARHQQEFAEAQRKMAEDIRLVAELTESSLEEARARRPEPVVFFLVGEERIPSETAVLHRKRLVSEIDVEAIVAHERERALATFPAPKAKPSKAEIAAGGAAYVEVERLAERMSWLTGGGPPTEDDREAFVKKVDQYADKLRTWLVDYDDYRNEIELIFRSDLRFENRGRVPARDVRVQLSFPDAFEPVEELPEIEGPPARPRFEKQSLASLLGQSSFSYSPPDFSPMIPEFRGNVSPPSYRRGSVVVEYEIDKLLHGIDEETDDPTVLRIEQDGAYEIPWEIHAENLAEPTTGSLTLTIQTEVVEGSAIRTLNELKSSSSTVRKGQE